MLSGVTSRGNPIIVRHISDRAASSETFSLEPSC